MNALSQSLSTGNKFWDSAIGGTLGYLQNDRERNPYGMFYANSNWKGDGIGDTSLGYAKNPYYRNYANDGHGLSAMLHGQKFNNPFAGLLGKLSGLGKGSDYDLLDDVYNYSGSYNYGGEAGQGGLY